MIESVLFTLLFLMLPILWVGLLNYSDIRLTTISIPSVTVAAMLIYNYIGFPILYFFLDHYRADFVQDRNVIWEMFLWSSYSITMVIFGFVLARKKFGPLHKKNKHNAFHRDSCFSSKRERLVLYMFFIISVAVLILYILKIGFGNLALLAAVGIVDTEASSNVLRSAMGNDFEGRYHWYDLFMRDTLSIVSFGFFANWLVCRRAGAFVVFLLSFLISAFSMLLATEKAPLLYYLIALIFIYVIINKNGSFPILLLIVLVPFGLVAVGFMYVYFMGSSNFFEGVSAGFSRLTTGQMQGLYHYLEIFPDQVDYLSGRSFPNPREIFPWEPYRLSVEVMDMVNPHLAQLGIVGSMPVFFWGEMYANFGYFGVIAPPFFLGYLVYFTNIIIFRIRTSPLSLAIFVWTALYISNVALTGLSGYIINVPVSVLGMIIFAALAFIGGGVIRFRNRPT